LAAIATLNTGLSQTDTTQATQIARGTIALTGSMAAGGDILNLALYGVQSNYPPLAVFVYEYPLVGATVTGYSFVYLQGADPSSGKLVPVLGGVPLAAGAYPAPLLTESAAGGIQFEAVFALGS
jgi:hypothetical protein